MGANVNQRVTSTPAQILQGSGILKCDGVDVGGYTGGVKIVKNQTEQWVDSDWSIGHIDSEIQLFTFQVQTELEEATLENLAIAWGLASSSVLSGVSSKTLALNPPEKMQECGLTFEGMSGTNRTAVRTFTITKAVRVGGSEVTLNRGIKTTIPVTFECILGTDGSYGTIVDTTI